MASEQAAEARRRKKEELARHLAVLDGEDRYYARASQPPDNHRHREQTYHHAAPISSYGAKPGVTSPPWLQTAIPTPSTRDWKAAPNTASSSTRTGHARHRPLAQSAFQALPDPVPLHISNDTAQAPWQRTRIASASEFTSTRPNDLHNPSPDITTTHQPRMPNPFSPSFTNIPVPSKEQVEVYLIRGQGQPAGLRTGWTIGNHTFDVYDVFLATTRLGGSKAVTRRHWWPELADVLGIPGVNSPQKRNIAESGRQLYTFFATHLAPLEEMWERTSGTVEDAGAPHAAASVTTHHSRSQLPRMRQPVSSAREAATEEISRSFTRTSPPQPPPPREAAASASIRRSVGRSARRASNVREPSNKEQQSAPSQSVPLHVKPKEISTRQNKQDLSASNHEYTKYNPYTSISQNTQTQARNPITAPAPSISPVLHQPAPATLTQQPVTDHLDQHASVQRQDDVSQASQYDALPRPSSTAGQSSGVQSRASAYRSKPFNFPSLVNYNPPKLASFDHLVQTNALTLPKLPPDVQLDYVGTPSEVYAKRCFELRSVVKKIQVTQPARHISVDEMTFWQKLLAILRHNSQVVIPGHQGHQPMTTDNAPVAPSQALSTGPAETVSATGESYSAPARMGSDGQPSSGPTKRKRGRPSKQSLGDPSDPPIPRKKGRPWKSAPTDLSTSISQSTSTAVAPQNQMPQAGPSNHTASAVEAADIAVSEVAMSLDSSALAPGEDADPVVTKTGPWHHRTNPDGTPIPRKPYTIRLNADGTPVSERFKNRVQSGNSYSTSTPPGSQTLPSETAFQSAVAGPSSQPAARPQSFAFDNTQPVYIMDDIDAHGEVDSKILGNGNNRDMTRFAQELVNLGSSSTGGVIQSASQPTPGSTGEKVKNPLRSEKAREAALRRWQKFREEREARGLPPTLAAASQGSSVHGTQSVPTGGYRQPASSGTASASTSLPKRGGGFAIPGAAKFAANKRWTLFHADGFADRSGRQPTPSELAYRNAVRSGSVKPFDSASPRRLVSLSGGGASKAQPGPAGPSGTPTPTPSTKMPIDEARGRAGSIRPGSSLPLFLTPAPRRSLPAPLLSEYEHDDTIEHVETIEPEETTDLAGGTDEMADDAFEPESEEEAPMPPVTRGTSSRVQFSPIVRTRSRLTARASLPSRLSRTPSSTRSNQVNKPSTRSRADSIDDPSPRSVLTRNARAKAGPSNLFNLSPSQGTSARTTRASSALPTRTVRSRSITIAHKPTPSAPRSSIPPSSQDRARMVPEVELVKTRPPTQVSPLKLAAPRPRSRPQTAGSTRIMVKSRIPMKSKPVQKPKIQVKAKPKPKPVPVVQKRTVFEPRVIVGINRATRNRLIESGAFDPFYDDDSDEDDTVKRRVHAGLRKIALPRGSHDRTARPTAPEAIPIRFTARVGPAILEPFASILDPATLLKRASEHECHWKGCDTQLASEWHLRKHFDLRNHALQGSFEAGMYGENTYYRCHWVECEKPCFASQVDLEQHMTARHISRTLSCPWVECDLKFTNLSHLTRHALRHHDAPEDQVRPMVDLSSRNWQPRPIGDQVIPDTVRADTLITPAVQPSAYTSIYRREWCALKIKNGSIAPPNPVLVPEHTPHMLAAIEDSEDDTSSDNESLYTTLDGGAVTKERLLDVAARRRKRHLSPVVDITVRKRIKAGRYQDLFESGDSEIPVLIDDYIVELPDELPYDLPIPDDPQQDDQQEQGSPRLRTRFALSESVQPPSPDANDDEFRGSESEVWAESGQN